jgi:hypothetical protein
MKALRTGKVAKKVAKKVAEKVGNLCRGLNFRLKVANL